TYAIRTGPARAHWPYVAPICLWIAYSTMHGMFTGIIQASGRVAATEQVGGDLRLTIDFADTPLQAPALGDSVAVNGVCLTATAQDASRFVADVSMETLELTTLGELVVGDRVNLEPALAAGDRLGGHLVSGHVDGVGELLEKTA